MFRYFGSRDNPTLDETVNAQMVRYLQYFNIASHSDNYKSFKRTKFYWQLRNKKYLKQRMYFSFRKTSYVYRYYTFINFC